MMLIVGLGNPGKKFEKTRHNLGFRVIDEFLKKNRDRMIIPCLAVGGLESNFRKFRFEKKFQAEISEGKIDNKKIILAKPQTFMNLSGKAVKLLIRNKNAMAELLRNHNLFVVHDDIDLPLGKIRISVGRGAAGHKGVESIIKELGTKNFVRFRVGIRPTEQYYRPVCSTEIFVLKKLTKEEEKILKEVIKKTVEAIEIAIKEGLDRAMSQYNK